VDGIPATDDLESLVIRTDFTDDAAWARVRSAITAPVDRFEAGVKFVNDRQFAGLTIEQLLERFEGSDHTFIFLVDRETLTHSEHPVLVVDLYGPERGRTFRVIPSAMWGVQNNLVIANMDWEDFADNVDEDGVFRDFR
jgi:hypothetical protein